MPEYCPEHEHIKEMLSDIKHAVCGNVGDMDKPGLAERVRLLERFSKAQIWVISVMIIAIATGCVGFFLR